MTGRDAEAASGETGGKLVVGIYSVDHDEFDTIDEGEPLTRTCVGLYVDGEWASFTKGGLAIHGREGLPDNPTMEDFAEVFSKPRVGVLVSDPATVSGPVELPDYVSESGDIEDTSLVLAPDIDGVDAADLWSELPASHRPVAADGRGDGTTNGE